MSRAIERRIALVLLLVQGAALGNAQPREVLAQLPLRFEAAPSSRAYVARGLDYQLLLTAGEAIFALDRCATECAPALVRARLDGAAAATATPEQELRGRSHYLHGSDPKRWARNVAQFARVRYAGIYPGIDLVYYGSGREVEYDFIVAPQADPAAIALSFHGVDAAHLDAAGDLVLTAGGGELRLRRPVAYQERAGARTPVAARYRLHGAQVAFDVGEYDRTRPLVIDPVVDWSTYLGSHRADAAYGIAVDAGGNSYVTGHTRYYDFPTTAGALEEAYSAGQYDGFVSKISADGTTLLYSTYLGGTNVDYGLAIAVDGSGQAVVAGYTSSADFPVQGASQGYGGNGDAFVARLSADGSTLLHSTWLGGAASYDYGQAVAVDAAGNAYVAGITWSTDFPAVRGFQPAFGGGAFDTYVAKFDPAGAKVYATLLGGSAEEWLGGIAVDASGRAYVAGYTNSTDFPTQSALQPANAGGVDAFVSRLSANGRALSYSTYLGGAGADRAVAIAVDRFNAAVVTGGTDDGSFPTLNPLQPFVGGGSTGLYVRDAFVSRLRSDGAALTFSTFLGGSQDDAAAAIALDANRNVYVAGWTQFGDFPRVSPLQASGGGWDAFVAKLRPNASELLLSTPLGGAGHDFAHALAVDAHGRIHVAGRTTGAFPTVDALQPRRVGFDDGFVTVIAQDGQAVPDVVQFMAPVFGVDENDQYARIRVTRNGTGYGIVTARIEVAPGTATPGYDYAAEPADVYWAHGQTGPRTFFLPIINDAVHDEPVETVNLALAVRGGFATVGEPAAATLRIREADDGTPQWVYVQVGFGNSVVDDGESFAVPFAIVVTNERGNPIEGATLALSVGAAEYQKGTATYDDQDGDGSGTQYVWTPHYAVLPNVHQAFGCPDEDANGNATLEPGEDVNGNGALDPGQPVTVPAGVVTGADGTAQSQLTYPKTHAGWVRVELIVAATGDFTSFVAHPRLIVSASSASAGASAPPPYQTSPYGVSGDCANPG